MDTTATTIDGPQNKAFSPIGRPNNRSSSRFRGFCIRLATIVVGVLVACVIGELGLRIGGYGRSYTNPMRSFFEPDEEFGCRGKANFVGRFRRTDFDVIVEHDAHGFRRGAAGAGDAGAKAVYVLGDSFAWGYGVGQEDLVSNQMARLLGDRRVCNRGVIGAGTVHAYLLFQKSVLDQLQPGDTVVLLFFGNDFGDNLGLHIGGRVSATVENGQVRVVPPASPSTGTQRKAWLRDTLYLFNLVAYAADQYQHKRANQRACDRTKRGSPPLERIEAFLSNGGAAVGIARHFLAEFHKACSAKQVRFLAAWVPGQAELSEDDSTSTSDLSGPEEIACRQAFERIVGDLGIETVDLSTPMLAAKRAARFARMTFVRDFHWNAAGHTIAAEAIADAIRRGEAGR